MMESSQIRDIREIELKLERIQTILDERNSNSKEAVELVRGLEKKFDTFIETLPDKYVTAREFGNYKNGMTTLLDERKDGLKSWQSWIMLLAPTLLSAIMTLYVLFGGRN